MALRQRGLQGVDLECEEPWGCGQKTWRAKALELWPENQGAGRRGGWSGRQAGSPLGWKPGATVQLVFTEAAVWGTVIGPGEVGWSRWGLHWAGRPGAWLTHSGRPQCCLACHKKCLETLAIQCGHKKLQGRLQLFGQDFSQAARSAPDGVPFIVKKCVCEIERRALRTKVRWGVEAAPSGEAGVGRG